MHEMSIAEGILQIVEDAAAQQGFKRVTEVRLEIGALSGQATDLVPRASSNGRLSRHLFCANWQRSAKEQLCPTNQGFGGTPGMEAKRFLLRELATGRDANKP